MTLHKQGAQLGYQLQKLFLCQVGDRAAIISDFVGVDVFHGVLLSISEQSVYIRFVPIALQ